MRHSLCFLKGNGAIFSSQEVWGDSADPSPVVRDLVAFWDDELVHKHNAISIYDGTPGESFSPSIDFHHFAVNGNHLCLSAQDKISQISNLPLECLRPWLEDLIYERPVIFRLCNFWFWVFSWKIAVSLSVLLLSFLLPLLELCEVLSFNFPLGSVVQHALHQLKHFGSFGFGL